MYEYEQASTWDKLTGSVALTDRRAAVIKETYLLFGLAVISAIAGGYVGATSETMARLFSGWLGWILALVLLNAVPRIAIAMRHNPTLGVTALVADGFISAVNEGSAAPAFDPDVVVAGKTGSCSQLGWFASYAPAENPEVVIVVFVRRGNGHLASGIAGRIYQDLYKSAPVAPPLGTAAGGG